MKDIPLYFGIRAFCEMLWDAFGLTTRLLISVHYACIFIYCNLMSFHVSYNICMIRLLATVHNFSIICAYLIVLYFSLLDLKRPYAWLAFFYRKDAYFTYDNVHPYAIY